MCTSCRILKMLSNAYFLTKFRFDTAEDEPAKNLQKIVNFANFANLIYRSGAGVGAGGPGLPEAFVHELAKRFVQPLAKVLVANTGPFSGRSDIGKIRPRMKSRFFLFGISVLKF